MDLRAEINEYFEKTPVPSEILPDKVSSFVKPKLTAKKAMPASESLDVNTQNKAAGGEKNEDMPSESASVFAEESGAKASDFIKVVFHHKLTGKEFLSILGNSKISAKAYREIESNPGLTVKRLIEILEESPLTSEDYRRLIIATERSAALKSEAKTRIGAEPSKPVSSSPITPPVSSKTKLDLTQLTSPKTMEVPEAVTPKTNRIGVVPADREDNTESAAEESEQAIEKEQEKHKTAKGKKLLFGGGNGGDDYSDDSADDDGEAFDYEDEDDEGSPKKRSNKGKFAAAAVGAAALIGISFGLRYYLTGSFFPTDKAAVEEVKLDERGIFNALCTLSSQQLSEFTEEPLYTVGGTGVRTVLKKVIATDRRLLYIRENSIYIFELIGGQLKQLEVRKYNEGIKVLGMAESDKGIAVVTAYEGDNYSYSYTLPSENPDETGTEVQGSVKRPETVIELLSAENPENRSQITVTRLSGVLSAIYGNNSRIIAITSENLAEGASADDINTFMPYAVTDGDKKLCSAENIVISDKPYYSTVSAVFAVELGGNVSIAGTAGGAVKASCLLNNTLYVGQSNVLAEFDLTEGAEKKGSCIIDGSFEDFSAIGASESEIRVTSLLNGSASLTVLDGELNRSSEINNLGNGEIPAATCFNGRETFVITETGVCYGIDAENNVISESGLKVTDSKIYPLSGTMGLKITPTDDGAKRTGITVTTVSLDGAMTELGSTVISSLTVAQNSLDEYLSSPAETDIYSIGAQLDESGGGFLAVPVVYFDGVSEVELFVIYSLNAQGGISVNGSVTDYDRRSKTILAAIKNGYVIAVTDSRITTARAENGSVVGYFNVSSMGSEYGY